MTANTETVEVRVRRRLRELRTDQGLTLQQVASRANMDVSTLSRLESGKRRLALDHLPALAAALGVSTDELVGSPDAVDPRVHADARTIAPGITLRPLTERPLAAGVNAYRMRIDGRRRARPDDLPTHQGHDWLHVVSGRLRLVLGDHDHVIEPGETVEFNTLTPHWFTSVDGPVDILALFGPHATDHTH